MEFTDIDGVERTLAAATSLLVASVSDQIECWRRKCGCSFRALSERSGIPERDLEDKLHGRKPMTLEDLASLFFVLGAHASVRVHAYGVPK